ncbi:MAG: hypothetical protein ACK4M2_01495 [Brevundimonas sp.]
MSAKPVDPADYALASDLGRKVAADIGDMIPRTFMLCDSPYQREVVAISAAAAAIVFARTVMRLATPDVTDADILEALFEGLSEAPQ